MTVGKTTRLEAVNTLLETIGLAPINTLTGTKTADVIKAENVLDEVSREVQTMGWYFNTEEEYPLARNNNNEIEVPPNIMWMDFEPRGFTKIDPVIRGDRLYDKANRTYKFDENIEATVIIALDFNELPETARRYVTIRAARIFGDRMVGEQALHGFTRTDEQRAWINFKDWQGETADRSIFDSPDMAEYKLRGRFIPRGIT